MSVAGLRDSLDSVSRETALVVGLIGGSQFFNHAYLVLLPPIFTILSGEFQTTIAVLGTVMGAQALANTVVHLPFGYLADHYDRTIALGLSSVFGGLGAFGTAFATTVPELFLAQVILGIGVGGHHPSHYPLLTDATEEDVRGRAFGVYNFAGSLGFATPPVVVTGVIALQGYSWRHAVGVIGVLGLLYAVVSTALVRWRVSDAVTGPNVESTTKETTLVERVRSELRALVASPGILALAVLALFSSTANWGVTSYVVVFLTSDVYGTSLGVANLTLTGIYVVGAGAILLGGYLTDRSGGGTVLVASFVSFTVIVAFIAAGVVPALGAVALFLLLGATRSMAGPARDHLTGELAAGGTTAKSFAVVSIGIMLGSAVAPPAFGYLIESFGVQAAFYAVAAVGLATTLVTLLVVGAYADE